MRITVKALLLNTSNEHQEDIDKLLTVFSSAKRFAYKRLLEKEIKKGEIEKLISHKYELNIRQSKDAVESARQLVSSQKVLVKDYHENYTKKVNVIESQIKKAKSNKKIENLNKKLEKRKIKQDFYKSHIDNNTIPKLLKDKLLKNEEKEKFNEENNWKQWTIISKKLKMKGGENPGFWLKHRKLILNIS